MTANLHEQMLGRHNAVVPGFLVALVALALAAVPASAATLQVEPGGNDASNCVAEACATIGHALVVAASGDTIQVAPGTYAEAVTVSKPAITLRGAQAGIARPGRTVPGSEESVISGNGPLVTIAANSAVVEGFAFQSAEGDAISANQASKITNLRVADNLRSGGDGTLLSASNAESLVVRDNSVVSTSAPAVFLGGEVRASLIEDNEFAHGSSTAIQLAATKGPNSETTIVGNDLSHVARGVRIGPGSVGTILIVRENSLAGDTLFGILDELAASFDARRNWWGCNGGPGAAGCSNLSSTGTPPDTGDWLDLSLSAEPASAVAGTAVALHADLLGSSTGTRAAGFPDGVGVSFASSLGAIGTVTPTLGGRATATLLAKAAGSAEVSATLDSQLARATVAVASAPAPPTPPAIVVQQVLVPDPAPDVAPRTTTALLLKEMATVVGGKAKVLVGCAAAVGQRCTGTLRLGFGGSTAQASFDLGAGRHASVAVRVPAAALERLDRNPRASVTALTRQESGGTVSSRRTLRLAAPGR